MADEKKQIYKNPLYIEWAEKYKKWKDFYEGGENVEQNLTYLPQHPYESNTQYDIRKTLATYKNLAKPIVSVFAASIWRKDPVRVLPSKLEPFETDIDGTGTGADVFFQDTDSKIAANGVFFAIVDSPPLPEGEENATLEDTKRLGIYPKPTLYSPLDVVDWGHDKAGELEYLVIHSYITEKISPWSQEERREQYKIWYKDRWESWRVDKDSFTSNGSGPNPIGEIPIAVGYFEKKFEMVGQSCFADILSLLRRAYNLENALDKSLFDTAFPQQAFYGFRKEFVESYIKSSANGLVGPAEASSEFLEPSGQSFSDLDKKIKNDEKAILEIILRKLKPETSQVESAKSKEIDRVEFNSQLSVFSRNCQSFEERVWKLMGMWMSDVKDSEIESIEIKYNDDFNLDIIGADMIKALSEAVRDRWISKKTALKAAKRGEALNVEGFDVDEEIEAIEEEARATQGMGAIGSQFFTGTQAIPTE